MKCLRFMSAHYVDNKLACWLVNVLFRNGRLDKDIEAYCWQKGGFH